MKYKVGDRVKIVAKRTGEGWNSDGYMDKWLGKTMTVTDITMNCYKMAEDVGDRGPYTGWCWWEHMIEGLANDTHKIVITTDGKTTLARLYDGKTVVKSAEAKCSQEDTFDFMIGAKIALDRLNAPKSAPEEKEFIPHLIGSSGSRRGNIGSLTNYKDAIGRILRVGDTVELYDEHLVCHGEKAIARDDDVGETFVMGIRIDCNSKTGSIRDWKIIKKRSFDQVADRENVNGIVYIKTK